MISIFFSSWGVTRQQCRVPEALISSNTSCQIRRLINQGREQDSPLTYGEMETGTLAEERPLHHPEPFFPLLQQKSCFVHFTFCVLCLSVFEVIAGSTGLLETQNFCTVLYRFPSPGRLYEFSLDRGQRVDLLVLVPSCPAASCFMLPALANSDSLVYFFSPCSFYVAP